MMKPRFAFTGFTLALCLALPIIADQTPPVFYFGGNRFYIGMPQHEAVAALEHCCKLSPPMESEVEKKPAPEGVILGHFVIAKDGPPFTMLGSISFRNGKILRMTRPMADDIDTYNDDLVAFIRALKRALPTEASDEGMSIRVSLRHERMGNAESDAVYLMFPSGRGIELHIATLDKPDKETNKRDFVTMDEVLE